MPVYVLKPPDAAQALGVTEDQLRRWRREGGGPPFMVWGRRTIRYRESDIKEWLAGQSAAHNTAEAAAIHHQVSRPRRPGGEPGGCSGPRRTRSGNPQKLRIRTRKSPRRIDLRGLRGVMQIAG